MSSTPMRLAKFNAWRQKSGSERSNAVDQKIESKPEDSRRTILTAYVLDQLYTPDRAIEQSDTAVRGQAVP